MNVFQIAVVENTHHGFDKLHKFETNLKIGIFLIRESFKSNTMKKKIKRRKIREKMKTKIVIWFLMNISVIKMKRIIMKVKG